MKLNWHPPKINDIKARFKSEADLSFDVHFGKLRADRTMMPARPYIDSAVSLTAFEEIIKEEITEIVKVMKKNEESGEEVEVEEEKKKMHKPDAMPTEAVGDY